MSVEVPWFPEGGDPLLPENRDIDTKFLHRFINDYHQTYDVICWYRSDNIGANEPFSDTDRGYGDYFPTLGTIFANPLTPLFRSDLSLPYNTFWVYERFTPDAVASNYVDYIYDLLLEYNQFSIEQFENTSPFDEQNINDVPDTFEGNLSGSCKITYFAEDSDGSKTLLTKYFSKGKLLWKPEYKILPYSVSVQGEGADDLKDIFSDNYLLFDEIDFPLPINKHPQRNSEVTLKDTTTTTQAVEVTAYTTNQEDVSGGLSGGIDVYPVIECDDGSTFSGVVELANVVTTGQTDEVLDTVIIPLEQTRGSTVIPDGSYHRAQRFVKLSRANHNYWNADLGSNPLGDKGDELAFFTEKGANLEDLDGNLNYESLFILKSSEDDATTLSPAVAPIRYANFIRTNTLSQSEVISSTTKTLTLFGKPFFTGSSSFVSAFGGDCVQVTRELSYASSITRLDEQELLPFNEIPFDEKTVLKRNQQEVKTLVDEFWHDWELENGVPELKNG